MNKYRILYYIMLVALLAACSQQDSYDLNGNWIGYKASRIIGKDTLQDNFHLLMSFKGDSLQVRNYKYIRSGDKDSLSEYYYKFTGDSLLTADAINTYAFGIVEHTPDHMVLSTGKTELHYRKLPDNDPSGQPFGFSGDVYTISRNGQVIDTARFWDGGTVEMYNSAMKRPHQAFYYALKIFGGHYMLVIDSPELPVFLIREAGSGAFELKKEPRDTAAFLMRKAD